MNKGSLADFLKRTVLDREFRALSRREPEVAFRGYELTDVEKEILVHGDERMLALLGQVVQPKKEAKPSNEVARLPDCQANVKGGSDPGDDAVRDTEVTEQRSAGVPGLKFVLRLTTETHRRESSSDEVKHDAARQPDWQISYSASFRAWNDADATNKDKPDNASPDVENAGGGPSESAWIIQLTPQVARADSQRLALSYAATIRPFTESDATPAAVHDSGRSGSSWSPWKHQTDSPAVREAADSVRSSGGEQRFAALCTLIKAMQQGGACG